MNYSNEYLTGAQMLDAELEQFNHNPKDFVQAMRWTGDIVEKAATLKDKLELVKKDYIGLESMIKNLKVNNPHFDVQDIVDNDDVQDFITNLFAAKILKALK